MVIIVCKIGWTVFFQKCHPKVYLLKAHFVKHQGMIVWSTCYIYFIYFSFRPQIDTNYSVRSMVDGRDPIVNFSLSRLMSFNIIQANRRFHSISNIAATHILTLAMFSLGSPLKLKH